MTRTVQCTWDATASTVPEYGKANIMEFTKIRLDQALLSRIFRSQNFLHWQIDPSLTTYSTCCWSRLCAGRDGYPFKTWDLPSRCGLGMAQFFLSDLLLFVQGSRLCQRRFISPTCKQSRYEGWWLEQQRFTSLPKRGMGFNSGSSEK